MTYLTKILEAHRASAAEDDRPLDQLVEQASTMGPVRGFAEALRATDGVAVISEIKRRSPSKGALNLG
ncbi:MAG: indole-3-glycerol phosphate synthase TrpC, partial [Acidimicrobiales bacterium]